MKEYFWDTPLQARLIEHTTKEPVNVVIDEASQSGSDKISEEIPKEILPLEPKDVQEIVDQEPVTVKCCRRFSRHTYLTRF